MDIKYRGFLHFTPLTYGKINPRLNEPGIFKMAYTGRYAETGINECKYVNLSFDVL